MHITDSFCQVLYSRVCYFVPTEIELAYITYCFEVFSDFINLLVSNISTRQIEATIYDFRLEGARYGRLFSHFFAHSNWWFLSLLSLTLRPRGSQRRFHSPSARCIEHIITSAAYAWTSCTRAPRTTISYITRGHVFRCLSSLEHHLHVIRRCFA